MPDVDVGPLPDWLDRARLLGDGDWAWDPKRRHATAVLSLKDAADVASRLRGLGFAGEPLDVTVTPPLPRAVVRNARTNDARRRRDTTPGFTRPGTRLDAEGRASLTPEALALALGRRAADEGVRTVLDAGCGAGGNAIGFARAGLHVVAIERDPDRADAARHNARVYGVEARVRVDVGDALEAIGRADADLLFLDPPWGVDWDRKRTTTSDLPDLPRLLDGAERFPRIWIKAPPSFDPTTLPGDWAPEAVFGEAEGDSRRVKFVLLRGRPSAA